MTEQVEVRYHMLRPAQVVERRRQVPVAYVPIGTIEWHGPQNPLGADTLQAEGLAELCARKGGGLVLPPLYYGESRVEGLMEANAADRDKIAQQMYLPSENFLPEHMPHSATEQVRNYQDLLLHILGEVKSLGFRLAVLVAGHYPLVDHARAAVLLWNQRHAARRGGMLAWAMADYLLVRDRWPWSGDHAAGWETSHLMALHGNCVDLATLPPKGQPLIGIAGHMPPQDATAAFGAETLEAAAEVACREVRHRLDHPELYRPHGQSLAEGLWKNV